MMKKKTSEYFSIGMNGRDTYLNGEYFIPNASINFDRELSADEMQYIDSLMAEHGYENAYAIALELSDKMGWSCWTVSSDA